MANISKKEVLHIAKLADLNIKENEIEKFRKQLSEIVNFVNQLNNVNTDKLVPTSQTTGLENIFREDVIDKESLKPEEATSQAKNTNNNYFLVKRILERNK